MRKHCIAAAVLAGLVLGSSLGFAQSPNGLERMYVLRCGTGHALDKSRWSPGVDVGVEFDVSDNCYLIKHKQGYMLWDGGIPDSVANLPDGVAGANGAPSWRMPKTVASQLAEIGVKPSDVKYIGISHTHPDHVGNVDMFPQATILIQKAEYDWAFSRGNPGFFASGAPRFSADHPATKLDGDKDVFGDGSVMIISTPGHTPGHQSLLVKLPKTGAVMLSGDAAHFKSNWDNKRIPAGNVDKEKSLTSMQHMADLLAQTKGQLWMNHDKAQSDSQKHAPEFYD
ncbi:MAG TPA: N-acyl homoserine lactonase family protein [Xanthobacteraceae bacterium]|jgi:glyoxylase-like metal-dependent hydrolase (beta-lactamase superfamily II)|nr:N-acyl homoserine lactonase family protein [Xanthobacteraceae bacterium]